MDLLTHQGLGTLGADAYAMDDERVVVTLWDGRAVAIERISTVPVYRHGLIRIVNTRSINGGLMGTMQFYQNEAMAVSALNHPRPADESRIVISRVAGAELRVTDGTEFPGTTVVNVWIDRWGKMEAMGGLTIEQTTERVAEVESRVAGTSVGFYSTVAFDLSSRRLLYMSLWYPNGIVRFSYHPSFPE